MEYTVCYETGCMHNEKNRCKIAVPIAPNAYCARRDKVGR